MASLTKTNLSCRNSFQLRLGLATRKSSLIHIRSHVRYADCRIRVRCAATKEGNGGEVEKKGLENSWESKDASGDAFSGWVGADSGDLSKKKNGFGGFAVVGMAGVILAAGLSLTYLSLSKRSSSGPKLQMESLTGQQEELTYDEQDAKVEQVGSGNIVPMIDKSFTEHDSNLESETVLQVPPGKVVVPAVVDQVQGQALVALQVLKVIEVDVQPTDLCTRREYARWLVSASGALRRNSISKVYPTMYIENVTELAFDDITPQDPDFTSIQGLAEAGLISSKLSRRDMLQSVDRESILSSSFLKVPYHDRIL